MCLKLVVVRSLHHLYLISSSSSAQRHWITLCGRRGAREADLGGVFVICTLSLRLLALGRLTLPMA